MGNSYFSCHRKGSRHLCAVQSPAMSLLHTICDINVYAGKDALLCCGLLNTEIFFEKKLMVSAQKGIIVVVSIVAWFLSFLRKINYLRDFIDKLWKCQVMCQESSKCS